MSTKYILMWLEAPLQSWGADSKFGRRDTLPFPTKSGVTGLVLCAMGASGEQRELLARLAPHTMQIVSFVRAIAEKRGTDKRIAREPLLRDFHMVGSGYDDTDAWQRLHIPKTAEGKPAVGGGTKLTYRYYLQDARFAAIMEVPADLAETIAMALQAPVFDIYLGRKNCVPTDFVYRGTYDNETDALRGANDIANDKGLTEDFRVIGGEGEGEVLTLNDVPVQFGEDRRFRDRRVTVVMHE